MPAEPAPQSEVALEYLPVAVSKQSLPVVGIRDALVGLRQRRVDVDGRGQGPDGDILLHREDYLVDQVSRIRPDDVSAQDFAPPAGYYLDEPLRLPVGDVPGPPR